MTLSPLLIAAALLAVLAFGWFGAKYAAGKAAPAVVQKAEARLEAYSHAELVKLAGSIMDHLADTSAAEQKIKDGQAEMASKAQLLAVVKARVAAATISAAS